MKTKNKKSTILVFILFTFTALTILLFRLGIFEYIIQRTLMANNPTVLFPCNQFKSDVELGYLLYHESDEKLGILVTYLAEIDGDIVIRAVGNRCPTKYEFVISFASDAQRIEIESILIDQTIGGTPVFLLNR